MERASYIQIWLNVDLPKEQSRTSSTFFYVSKKAEQNQKYPVQRNFHDSAHSLTNHAGSDKITGMETGLYAIYYACTGKLDTKKNQTIENSQKISEQRNSRSITCMVF